MKIELKKLRYVYPSGEEALKGIDLVMEGTDPVAVIGQNGAGKTTLVKHFNGILRPSSGDVLINGERIQTRSTAKWSKHIGYVFQNPDDQLFLESVRKEFEFGPKQIGMSQEQIQERMEWTADLVGMTGKLDVHPFDLTAAEKKFCTIGAVIMMNPDAVIFDEPTCGQDVQGNLRLHRIIQTLKERGKLCITISHDMKFAADNFKRIVVMCRGEVILDGRAKEVFAQAEILNKSFVLPPPITRVAQGAGLQQTVFTTEAFMEALENERTV
ncbi:energy-coupling factor ABC transporter ATP-binding protein [Anaerostipes sp.]|uniref:energy-coupling factor ABC transporter ATP-binding protein n=1 Tax=Anaerostipes sp. TaxID=1872530 RepID=UPI0025B87C0D|nr:ABC transporter ATP-binding protein [Anaerostipes sp.]MBS7008107.1 ABC transporter ATP-binding protein [Anaerostipes sp.]